MKRADVLNSICSFSFIFIMMLANKKIIRALNGIIIQAEQIGLLQQDLYIAKEYINHNEFGLCLEHIIEQLFEYDIQINEEIYNSLISTGKMMKMAEHKFSSLKNLVAF